MIPQGLRRRQTWRPRAFLDVTRWCDYLVAMTQIPRVTLSLLLALALLAIAGPATGHVTTPAAPAAVLATTDALLVVPVLSAASVPPGLPWHLPAAVAALALAAVTARHRPRRAVLLALVLLLCVFAFEHAVHSVHHGFGPQQQAECTVAAASAQLAAVQVDDVGLWSPVLPVIDRAEIAPPPFVLTRPLGPDQGRAPPSSAVL
jgi:hypothetical protein